MHETAHRVRLSDETLKVIARLAQPHAAEYGLAHPKLLVHEVVQVDAERRDVAPRLARRQLDAELSLQTFDRLAGDQRDLAAGPTLPRLTERFEQKHPTSI